MDKETIIKLACEAGLIYWHPKPSSVIQEQAAGVWWIDAGEPGDELEYFAKLVAEHEREACAKVCDDIDTEYEGEEVLATWCAAAIRARGK